MVSLLLLKGQLPSLYVRVFMSVCWGSGVSAHEKVGQGTDRQDRVSVKRAAVFWGASRIQVPCNPPVEAIHHSSLNE